MIAGDAPDQSRPPYSARVAQELETLVAKYDHPSQPPADQLFARFIKQVSTAYVQAWREKRTLRVTA